MDSEHPGNVEISHGCRLEHQEHDYSVSLVSKITVKSLLLHVVEAAWDLHLSHCPREISMEPAKVGKWGKETQLETNI